MDTGHFTQVTCKLNGYKVCTLHLQYLQWHTQTGLGNKCLHVNNLLFRLQFIFIFINLTFSWSGQIHTWLDVDTVSMTIPSEATASSMCVIMDLVETLLEDQCTTWASLAWPVVTCETWLQAQDFLAYVVGGRLVIKH